MPNTPDQARSVTLALSLTEQWTLHHVLLDRIEQEATADESAAIDPPPVAVFQAFETLNGGETTFTIRQLTEIQPILAEYHHSPGWENDRSEFEQLLHRVTEHVDHNEAAQLAD